MGFSPLDEALALGTQQVSPHVLAWLVELGATLPFRRAAQVLASLTGVQVSAATVRRHTEAVGATAVALADAEVGRLEHTLPEPPCGPPQLVLGADGAMVPLVGGEWAEVKVVSVGIPDADGQLTDLSYFARLADATTFTTQASGELHRRGVETATQVAAVQDGALWLQGFIDWHRPDAVRILDWPHACEHLSAVVEALFGRGTARTQQVVQRLRTWLWEEGPTRLLAVLRAWHRVRPDLAAAVAYFTERQHQLWYPAFRAAGWPVGSGATESAHKQLMQVRLKGAGMHWQRAHVNPLLALRTLLCNDRWAREREPLFQAHRARGVQNRPPPKRAPVPSPPPMSRPPALPPALPPRSAASPSHPWHRYGVPLSPKS